MSPPDDADADASAVQTPPPVESATGPAPDVAAPVGGARKAAVWTVLGFGTMQVLRFGSNLILARLLVPELFGLMALVNVFIMGLHMFSDVGIGPAIIQSKRGDDRDFLNTAWTLQIIRGLGLWLAALMIAWPVAVIYDHRLLWLIPAVGLNELIAGFNSTAMVTLGRRLYRGRLVLVEVASYALSITVVIVWINAVPREERNVWPLVVGSILASFIQLGFSHVLLPGFRNAICWDRTAIVELLHFGKWIFVGTLFTFLAGQADRLIVGMLSLGELGIYHFGAMLATMPTLLMHALGGQLIFPLYSRLQQQGRGVGDAFARIHPVATGIAAILISGLIATGPALVRCLYPDRYQAAGWMVQVLAVGAWFQILEATGGTVLWALGQARPSAISNGVKVGALLVFVPLGYGLGNFPGMLCGFVAADVARYLSTLRYVRAQGLAVLKYDTVLSLLIAAIAAYGLGIGLLPWAPDNKYGLFLLQGTAVVLVWGIVAAVCWRLGLVRLSLA